MNEKQIDYFTNFRNTIETLQNRRQVMNASFLTAMTLIISAMSLVSSDSKRITLSAGGVVLSIIWIMQLSYYKEVARSKFKIIDKYEKELKLELNKMEYQDMVNSKTGSDWEKSLPVFAIFVFVVVVCVIKVFNNG